jgi:hypothetical protein
MTSDQFDYAERMHGALLGIVRDLLKDVAKDGLPGDHHFYLTFDTTYEGVVMPTHLKERHPSSMTIVVQHQYWDLIVTDAHFSLQLSFNGQQESLSVPFEALTSFVDPSVQFGLPLQENAPTKDIVDVSTAPAKAEPADIPENEEDPVRESSNEEEPEPETDNVITLDRFRKT